MAHVWVSYGTSESSSSLFYWRECLLWLLDDSKSYLCVILLHNYLCNEYTIESVNNSFSFPSISLWFSLPSLSLSLSLLFYLILVVFEFVIFVNFCRNWAFLYGIRATNGFYWIDGLYCNVIFYFYNGVHGVFFYHFDQFDQSTSFVTVKHDQHDDGKTW